MLFPEKSKNDQVLVFCTSPLTTIVPLKPPAKMPSTKSAPSVCKVPQFRPHQLVTLAVPPVWKSNEIGVADAVPVRPRKPISAIRPPHLNLCFMNPDSL